MERPSVWVSLTFPPGEAQVLHFRASKPERGCCVLLRTLYQEASEVALC